LTGIGREVSVHVEGIRLDLPLGIGIKEDDIGVGTLLEGSFTGIEPENLRRVRRGQSGKCTEWDPARNDRNGMQKGEPRLDAWKPAGDLRELP
jgi:hypothetical protein